MRQNGEKMSENNDTINNQEEEYEKICYICRRPESKAGKMIAMPGNVYVCQDCLQKTFDTINNSGMNYDDMMKMSGMPNMGMFGNMNYQDIDIPENQKIKKKKKVKKPEEKLDLRNIPAPHEIKHMLDEYVVGQDYAKKVMSVAVYNHYKRVAAGDQADVEIEKSNMLMIGPTGSGKTYLVKTLARLLQVPLAIADATSLTEAGYIGDDIESVVSKLLAAADNDVERAEHGIIFIDEIDKIAKKKETRSRDVSGESVQQGMLKLLEGSDVEVPVGATSKNAMVPQVTVSTKNILFICGGAFEGIDKIIEKRIDQKSIGFNAEIAEKHEDDVDKLLAQVLPQDLVKFGLIPELVGRVPVTVSLEMLDHDALIRILTEPKNAIVKQYQKLLELDGVKLVFDDSALNEIADISLKRKTGARGLRAIMENTMMDIMYRAPSDETLKTCRITGDVVTGKAKPECEHTSVNTQSA